MVVNGGRALHRASGWVWLKLGYVFLCRDDGMFYFGFAQHVLLMSNPRDVDTPCAVMSGGAIWLYLLIAALRDASCNLATELRLWLVGPGRAKDHPFRFQLADFCPRQLGQFRQNRLIVLS